MPLESQVRYVDFNDVCPDIHPTCTSSEPMPYWRDEKENLTPALEAAGYEVHGGWRTGDGDSFGPLTRYVQVSKGRDSFRVIYG